jgi:hypothetical protein
MSASHECTGGDGRLDIDIGSVVQLDAQLSHRRSATAKKRSVTRMSVTCACHVRMVSGAMLTWRFRMRSLPIHTKSDTKAT